MSRQTQAVRRILGWLVRGSLVGLWAFVGWGTLLLLATAAGALSDGPGVALARLVPSRGAPLLDWLNGLSAAFALAAWLMALGLFVWSRWPSVEDPEPES